MRDKKKKKGKMRERKSNLLKPASTPFAHIRYGSFAGTLQMLKQSDCKAFYKV